MLFQLDPFPEILFGPPGTGKTTRLIGIQNEELERGVPPDRIGLVSFTRQAANEAMNRALQTFTNLTKDDFPHHRTLHSLCMRWSEIPVKNVMEGKKLEEFADWIGEKITGRQAIDGVWSGYNRGDRLLFMDNLARIRRVPLRKLYEEDHDDLEWSIVERFSKGLKVYKQHHNLYDFSDMLENFVAQRKKPKLEVLLVDEAQDLSLLQWDAVKVLAEGCRRVVVSGDDDQAIFEWSGASADTLIDLNGQDSVLDQSYRVPRKVQAVADSVIKRIKHRKEKIWKPRDEDGTVRHIRSMEEADFSGNSTMILSRNRHQLDDIEYQMKAAGVLYSREGAMSVKRSTLEAIVTWERLRRGEPQRVKDIVEGPYELMPMGAETIKRGHKKLPGFGPEELVTMDQLKERGGLRTDKVWHESLEKISVENRLYIQKCRRNGEQLTKPPRIKLSTIHGAKGGEADRIILMTDMAQRTYKESFIHPDQENRVLYVGITRARKELCIVAPQTARRYKI